MSKAFRYQSADEQQPDFSLLDSANVYDMTAEEVLDLAIAMLHGVVATADRMGVSRQAVYLWFKHGIPMNRAIELERLLQGKITRQQLRPDLYL